MHRAKSTCWLTILIILSSLAWSQQFDAKLFEGMRWRLIGPFRAGRVTAVSGISGDPTTYYMGTPGGGVWKTNDGGIVWKPIFDQVHVASIGALQVAPSNHNIIYAGTGEQTDGNGVYRSSDAGATWTNIGLRDTHIINSLLVDPLDPNVVFVGAMGGAQPSADRGVFKSSDGGKTWNKVLFKDDSSGVVDMCFDPGNHKVLFAAFWRASRGFFGPPPSERKATGPDASIYKSTDEGKTWKQLSGAGLPHDHMGRIGIAVAPGNHGRRVFAIMDAGLFRSDDGGDTWQRITTDPRVTGSWYFSRVYADPKDPDLVYVMQTALYRSTDGGRTFIAYRGAPGGDDYHNMWIDPTNTQRMILGVDQGATISQDGGKTFSVWYNQPTGQFYHVNTDHQFPYIAYAEQQDSGTAAVPSRSDYGRITFRDWFSVGGFEFGYATPDPKDPNTVYATGWYGTVVRFDKATGQINYVFVPGQKHRSFSPPMQFSPHDQQTLYLGTQYVLKTSDRGVSWQIISPDLSMKPATTAEVRKGGGEEEEEDPEEQAGAAKGMISALSLSPVRDGSIWVGTTNGIIHLSRDNGANWENITPPALPDRSLISALETSHFDADSAYVAVTVRRDSHPYFYRTHDGGKTWQPIVNGLPEDYFARVIREDPVRKGLLYAGTENAIYVSFDDGDHWQSLQLNLPTASVRDLAVHGDDLVAATFGRALWILDDLSPLRQLNSEVANSEAYFFRPAKAVRVRWDNYQETPLPPEMPTGDNPPEGAILDYYLKSAPSGDITLTINDAHGNLVRRYSSVAPTPDNVPRNVPDYWLAPPTVLSKQSGMHRIAWDLRYPDSPALRYGYFGALLDYQEFTLTDHAVPGKTPQQIPQGSLVVPGQYEAVLTVDGKTYRQAITVGMDPRVQVSQADLADQFELAQKLADAMTETYRAQAEVSTLRKAIGERQKSLATNPQAKEVSGALEALAKEVEAVETGTDEKPGFAPLNREVARLLTMVEEGDMRPPETLRDSATEAFESLRKVQIQWQHMKEERLPAMSAQLAKYQAPPLP